MMICSICNNSYKDLRVLSWHVSKNHKDISAKDYTIKYFYEAVIPKCKCGCGEDAPFRHLGKFMTYVNGHNTTVNNGFKGKKHTDDTIKLILNSDGFKNKRAKGKFQPLASEDTKRKMRIARVNNLIKNNGEFFAGKNENSILDAQEIRDNCKILRSYPIKEIGYVVDGYDVANNRIYEVYEKFHSRRVLKDLKRENEICNHLNCDFVILYDNTH